MIEACHTACHTFTRPSCNILLKADVIEDGNARASHQRVDGYDNPSTPETHRQEIILEGVGRLMVMTNGLIYR